MEKTVETIENFMKKNGFIWGPEPEIYDSIAGLHSYGPLGKLLKRNIENIIRREFEKAGFFEIESPLIAPKEVWLGSGHLKGFVDWVVECSKCKASFRADKLVLEKTGKNVSGKKLLETIDKEKIKCPSCKGEFVRELKPYNLMVRSDLGGRESYSRPETATMTYLSFKRYYEFFRKQFPIKVFQIGKAFRNEISPRQNVIRGREFTQAEGQIFIKPGENYSFESRDFKEKIIFIQDSGKDIKLGFHEAKKKKLVKKDEYLWSLFFTFNVFRKMGIPNEKIRLRQHEKDEKAHYALDAWDIEIKTESIGWVECCGVHDRTDFDLKGHSREANEDLKVKDDQTKEEFYPYVLEIAFGVDRPVYCLIDLFLDEETIEKENRIVLRLPVEISPVKAAVFPLVKKDGLKEISEKIYMDLLEGGIQAFYDESGSIGRRYRRIDEKGVPFALTIDYQTKEDYTVTIRFRDSLKQKRIKIKDIGKEILN